MDRDAALQELPEVYRALFVLVDDGWSASEIGRVLGIEESSVPALLAVGSAKLSRLTGTLDED